MKSTNTTEGALGNAKLKGKITGRMNCKCCTAINFKQKLRKKEMLQEIKTYIITSQGNHIIDHIEINKPIFNTYNFRPIG